MFETLSSAVFVNDVMFWTFHDRAHWNVPRPFAFCQMQRVSKLDKRTRRAIAQRLRAFWGRLKAHFRPMANDDIARAEEQHRGRNEPPDGPR
jgi:hypothetical protein